MTDFTDEEFAAANERGRVEFQTQPHAARAHFDRSTGVMTLDLYNGCAFSFPPRLLQGLHGASDEQLEAFELSFTGFGLHWEELDADFTVPGLLSGLFGTVQYMQTQHARLGEIYDHLLDRPRPGWDTQAAE